PWDAQDGNVRPPLKELIEEKNFQIPTSGRAIVPGCGRGYDAAYFARLGLESWGVDISESAIEAAKQYVSKTPNPPSNVHFKALDFFNFPLPEDGKKFVLAYDYTFLCALPPSLREAWGKRYAEIIEKDGLLLALMFPIDGDREGGPPYSVSPELYTSLLGDSFDRVYFEKPASSEGRDGREMMSVWKRK
ncbi:S-adenosyl-L-methionine-dependent methyltransferase, partial [Cystobasidium minutum MCA 4210]|uniref:S-adenosyl-L-methionine-dependent methyltransferase n=1 Tax=Cystobasidium minutum MCA 4210 TaxID=1397322 RepID=UPI0034CDFAAF